MKRMLCPGLLVRRGDRRLILVTSAFHMSRVTMLFRRVGAEVIQFPADCQTSGRSALSLLDFVPQAGAIANFETALREVHTLVDCPEGSLGMADAS